MTQSFKPQQPGQAGPSHQSPSDAQEVIKQKQAAEEREVAGRHKGDGQKDHKGAR